MGVETLERIEWPNSLELQELQVSAVDDGLIDGDHRTERAIEHHGTVFMGGGSGVSAVAREIVNAIAGDITFIVGTADSGSKTGVLRDMYQTPAVGDLRRVVASLAVDLEAGKIFDKRFGKGGSAFDVFDACMDLKDRLKLSSENDEQLLNDALGGAMRVSQEIVALHGDLEGHTFGNLMLTHMITNVEKGGLDIGLGDAVARVSEWLGVDERVAIMPASEDPHHLRLIDGDHIYDTEGAADDVTIKNPLESKIELYHINDGQAVTLYEPAGKKIRSARSIIKVPSSAKTSHEAMSAVPGIQEAIRRAQELVVVANPMEDRDTRGVTVAEFTRMLGSAAGRMADYVFINTSKLPEGEVPLRYSEQQMQTLGARVRIADLVEIESRPVEASDPLAHIRSRVRTRGDVLAGLLIDLSLAKSVVEKL